MNIFKTFIASSLKGEFLNIRKEFANALCSLNNDSELAPLNFSTYRFEEDGSNVINCEGSQNEINMKIEECQAFVVICNSNIGKKTVEEFRRAQERCKRFLNPTFIMVLKQREDVTCGENQITYDEFKRKYLEISSYNNDGSINNDYTIYEYEFDNIDDATEKLKKDLKEWITENVHRPLFKAELGVDVTPSFLYKDESRKKKCDEKMYFKRDFDDKLDQALMSDEPVIQIKGASLSGKTRALYQAIKNIPDAWFYKFKERHVETKLIAEINEIVNYIRPSKCASPLYLIFDDIHQMPSTEDVKYALEELLDAIKNKNIHIITTSTSSDNILLRSEKIITIKSLTRKEHNEAELFFKRHGLTVEKGYQEVGAMIIDLKEIKNNYEIFRSNSSTNEKPVRECLLYAIKAMSIWHSLNIGNVEELFELSKYMLEKEGYTQEEETKTMLYKSINSLLTLPGISQDGNDEFNVSTFHKLPKYINIEEYIYRYVLDKLTLKKEQEMINSILGYVYEIKKESIIVTLSKLSRRTENRKEIAQSIYDMVMGIYHKEESTIPDTCTKEWREKLNKEIIQKLNEEIIEIKTEVTTNLNNSNEECSELCIYMAKIIWSRMLYIESYDEAKAFFDAVTYPLQSLPMLGVLIVKSSGNLEELQWITDRDNVNNSFYIINKLIPFATDFDKANELLEKGVLLYTSDADYVNSSKRLRTLVEDKKNNADEWKRLKIKDIDRYNFICALNSLAEKVGSLDDLEKLAEVIRVNYVLLLDDLDLAERFIYETDNYSRDKLTIIDLISRLNFYAIRAAFINIFSWGNYVPFELYNLTNRIIEEFIKTSNLYTPRYKSKHTVCTIFNTFIEKCHNCSYKEVFKEIFLKMNVQMGKKIINLSDSFTYSVMMRMKDCKYMDALDLYYNFIKPHSKEPDSRLRITHFMLNEILNKVNTPSEFNKISRLFDENDVSKDVITYNLAMRNLSYKECVKEILPQMCKDNIEIDIYTLGTLISKAPNVKVAAGYFYPLLEIGIRAESNMIDNTDVKNKLKEKIEDYTKNLPLEEQHYLWSALVGTHCRNDEDREVLFRILEYMENPNNKKHILGEHDNGIIYNNCIKNRSFIRNFEEAKNFMSSKRIKSDKYTLTHLIKIIEDDYNNSGDYVQKITCINDLYRKNKEMIQSEIEENNTYIYNNRLRFYRSHADKLQFVFILRDGTTKTEKLTPMKYLEYLHNNNLPIDQYTFRLFAGIKDGQSVELLENLIKFINENGLFVNHSAIDSIVERFKNVILENNRIDLLEKIYDLPVKDNIISGGKAIVKKYSLGLYTLKNALDKITTENNTEKLYLYTQILTQYRKFALDSDKNVISPNDNEYSSSFHRCKDLYNTFVLAQKIVPNVDILSVLSNFATNKNELQSVFNELKKNSLAPSSYFITSILHVSKNLQDVKSLLGTYIEYGGAKPGRPGSENEVDIILRGINIIWMSTRDNEIHEKISGLTDYILSDADHCDVLNDFPCFKIYKDNGGCLTQKGLCELLKCWPYGCDDKQTTKDKYIERLQLLLSRYYNPDNDAIRPALVESLSFVYNKLRLDHGSLFCVLKPYPKLAFELAKEINIDYDTYRLLVESWNNGFDEISQKDAIEVLLAKLQCLPEESNEIFDRIFEKWDAGISVADFLMSKDTNTLQNAIRNVAEYKENDKLRQKYLSDKFQRLRSSNQYDTKQTIALFVDTFGEDLSYAEFLESELKKLDKSIRIFDNFKPLLYSVSGEKESVIIILCYMADRITSYSDLYYIIENICSEEVDITKELAQKIVSNLMQKKYDDYKIKFVTNQILTAIHNDRIVLNDLLYVPISFPYEQLQRPLNLDEKEKSLYRLIYNLSSEMNGLSSDQMIMRAEELICTYYKDKRSRINSLVVQELIGLYILAYNKQNDKESKNTLFEKISKVLSVPYYSHKKDIENSWYRYSMIDTSVLFSAKCKAILNNSDNWYKVPSINISRMVMSFWECEDKAKLDIVYSSGIQHIWWNNAYKGNFAKLFDCFEYVKSKPESHYAFMNSLFNEATNGKDFIQALNILISEEKTNCNINVVIKTLISIICKDTNLITRLLEYNEKQRSNKNYKWYTDASFFNFVFEQNCFDESTNVKLQKIFEKKYMKALSIFVSEIHLRKSLSSCKIQHYRQHDRKAVVNEVDKLIGNYVSNHSRYFEKGGRINNGLLIATYINTKRSATSIIQKIMTQSSYNSSMLPSCASCNNIFTDKMDYYIFKELSSEIEKRRYQWITTQKLLHKLLLACGNDFVLEAPQLLVLVAKTLKNADEYRWFTEDLMKFYLPVTPELTIALMDAVMIIQEKEKKNWILKKVVSRLRALAEYELCFAGDNCKDFKAGYFLLRQEQNIDFDNYWARQPLHIKSKVFDNMVKKIKNAKFDERINVIMDIDSIMLRCMLLLRFYVENKDQSKKNLSVLNKKISDCFKELTNFLNSPDTDGMQISSLIRLFRLMTKHSIKVPKNMSESMFLGVVKFYRRQTENKLLGNTYKIHVEYVLNIIKYICDSNRRNEKPNSIIYYRLFTNNKEKKEFPSFECDTETLYNALK